MSLFQIVLAIHILFAIIWVGGVLFVGWGVYPTANKLPLDIRRQFLRDLLAWTHHLFTLTGLIVIMTEIILGTVLGPIRTWNILFSTSYGHTWLMALIIATLTLTWGVFIGYRHALSVISNNALWEMAAEGNKRPLRNAFMKTTMLESVEIFGFISLVICMVLF